jgi:hypothetical protein
VRPPAALIAVVVALLLTGCSGGEAESVEESPAAPPGGSLEALWRGPGENVTSIAGTFDHGVGPNRISFLIANGKGELVERPTARIWLAHGLKDRPFATTTAHLEPVGVPGGSKADAQYLYVMHVDAKAPGTLFYVAKPLGGKPIQALGSVKVRKRTVAPGVGDRAIASRTPTIRSTRGDLEQLSTSRRPDPELYRVSVAEALAAREPFVLTFATPQFCQTRVCGPVVDVVSATRRRMAGSGVRFIHVEIYEDNTPGKGVNRWVNEWRLPTEPYTFVVDRRGVIRSTFEGAASVGELTTAARQLK